MAEWHDKLPFNPEEHLQPQVPLGEMQDTISQNYIASQNYYASRRRKFIELLKLKGISVENGFKNDIKKIIDNTWSNMTKEFTKAMATSNKGSERTQFYLNSKIAAKFPLDQYLLEKMFESTEMFYQRRGYVFEDFLQKHIFSKILQDGQSFVNGHVNNLVSLAVGKEQSKASIVKDSKSIRTDHLIALESMTFSKKNGVFQESSYKKGIPLELQGRLTVDFSNALPSLNNSREAERIAERLLGRTGAFFGFQAKTYSNLKDARWMNSSVMQGLINSVFNQTDSKGSRHTWENEYAGVYTTYFLSHQLMAIINPVNIGLVTGNNFYWMDEVLATRRFYMKISMADSFGKHKRSNTKSGFPQVDNSTILFTNYASQTKGFKEGITKYKDGIIRVTLN